MKKSNKKITLNALGKAAREQALLEKPDGFKRVNAVHKNAKKYSRKPKHKKSHG